jgi:DNA-binding XRE family transcriptional regulator
MLHRWPRANIGIITDLSGVTVVDIDDASLVEPMTTRFGDTPLKTASPSGGVHLWYCHNGEKSGSLRDSEGLAVDVKGRAGLIIVPPSVRPEGPHAGKPYRFLTGSWDDLKRLPAIRPGSLPGDRDTAAGPVTKLHAVRQGQRNDTLFRMLLRQARSCDDFEALVDVARTIADDFEPPLADGEVIKTARSAWDYETNPAKENWAGRGQRIYLTESEIPTLLENPDALALYVKLKMAQGGDPAPRAVCPKAMAEAELIPGWRDKRRYKRARDWLVGKGLLRLSHQGGRGAGDPSLFTLSYPASPKGASLVPQYNKTPRPRAESSCIKLSVPRPRQASERADAELDAFRRTDEDFQDVADPIAFGVMLREARRTRQMSQGEAAALVGLSRSAFGNIETGRYRASTDTQRRLLKALEGCVSGARDDLDGEPSCQTISTKLGAC